MNAPAGGIVPDSLPEDIGCLAGLVKSATFLSSAGFNCDVWRLAGTVTRGNRSTPFDFVIKRHREPCPFVKVRAYKREYALLKRVLDDIVPTAHFVVTRINAKPGLVVLADTCEPWFDLANANNESEVAPLLARSVRARTQLEQFVSHARAWADSARVIDLYGGNNLVMDWNLGVRYLDSFGVFFYTDVEYALGGLDTFLAQRVEISLRRLDYLEALLESSQRTSERPRGKRSRST